MNLTSMAIGRPITTVMLCVAVLIFGTLSLFQVPVDLLPDVNFPVITVETRIAGYSPVEVEDLITKPVEGMVSTMNHVQRVSSTSSEGLSRVEIRFALGTHMDYVAAEVSERINLIRDTFPKDARNPQVKKYNPSEAPVISVAAYGDLPAVRLRQIVEDVLGKRLKRIEGVGNVEIKGGKEREIIVEIDHGRLKAYGLSIEEIADSLKANNMNVQVGSVVSGSYRLTARAEGGYGDLSQIETMGIRSTSSGSVVPLKELGRVSDAFRREENRTRFQGEPRVVLYVQKESGANVIRISEELRRELDRLQDELPKELKLEVIYDQADYIQASIKRLRDEALIGAGLAMIVIFLFLRNLPSVFVIGAAIPVSIIATFTMMHLFGITLNIISLSGFTLGVGMLVDNAIVVMENISKKRMLFSDRTRASLLGTGEVIKAITVSTFAHIAVFMPVIFLQKKIKLLYSGLFFTVSFSLLASLLVALTLVPLLTSRLRLHPTWGQERKLGSYRWYRHFLVSCLRHRGKIITGGVVLFGGSLLLTPLIGFEPMARMDRGAFSVVLRTPPGTSLSGTDETAKEAERILLDSPHVKDVSTEVGEESVTLRVRLIPDFKRVKRTRQVVEELRPQLAAIPRAQSHFDVDTGTGSGNKIILEVNGHDQKVLATLAVEVKRRVLTLEGIKDVVIYQTNPKPELLIKVLHDKAGAYGLDATRISEAVRSRITGPIATEFVEQGKETDLRIRLQNDDLKNLSVFNNISLPVALNAQERVLVPLGEVTTSELVLGTAEIHRKDQHRMISISADIGSEDLGRAAVRVGEALKDFPFPEGYSYNFGEDYQELKESQKEMIFSLFLAILFVYMILAALFESFLYPITIMASVPMAAIGCLVILYVSGKSINVPVYVGAITLAGIVVNNAVVLIDYIKLLKSRGMGRWRAIIRGGENRLRPILMTSGTTLLALLPMALDTGEGSNLWSPLAVTIIGGLITSTLLTLIVIPLLASYVEDI
ncbi:MAG: multidrug transporter [Deltaproteobacteria bacterium]|nr:multidrug transporter [Deltaproteobacteria bacterium]